MILALSNVFKAARLVGSYNFELKKFHLISISLGVARWCEGDLHGQRELVPRALPLGRYREPQARSQD